MPLTLVVIPMASIRNLLIDVVLHEQPQRTVPEPEDTPLYDNDEGVNAE